MLVHWLSKFYVVILHLVLSICMFWSWSSLRGLPLRYFALSSNTTPRLEVVSPSSYFDSHLVNMDMHASLCQLQLIWQSAKNPGKILEGISITKHPCINPYSNFYVSMSSDPWVLLEAYPTNPTPTLQILFGPNAQVGLIYVCWFIKV